MDHAIGAWAFRYLQDPVLIGAIGHSGTNMDGRGWFHASHSVDRITFPGGRDDRFIDTLESALGRDTGSKAILAVTIVGATGILNSDRLIGEASN